MDIFYLVLLFLGIVISGYLIGSVSWARIITKYIYHVDIYKVGSGNAGGTNVGRAVGKGAAIFVILLDIFKCVIPLWSWFFIITFTPLKDFILNTTAGYLPLEFFYYSAGIGAGMGHVFPIYSHFKGGKAVSCYAGFIIGTNWLLCILGCACFFLVFAWKKRVSLSSITGVSFVAFLATTLAVIDYFIPGSTSLFFWFFPGPKMETSFYYMGFVIIYTLLVIILHQKNIKRLAMRKEPVTRFRHKGEGAVVNYDQKEGK